MVAKLNIDLQDFTRLTKAGRLGDAVGLIRKALQGERGGTRPPDATPSAPADRPGFAGAAIQPSAMASVLRQTLGNMATPPAGFAGLAGLSAGTRSSAPRVVPPAGALFEEHVFSEASGRLAYKLYVPSTYKGRAMPLVVMLHGCTQSPDDFAVGTRMNEVAEEAGLLVAYPAQTQAANQSKCWNWFNVADQQRGSGEPALIAGVTRQVMRDFAVDPARVYVAGLSAGGAAAAIMAQVYPDLYAAAGVHSGLACGAARDVSSAFSAMRQGSAAGLRGNGRQVPTIVFHGDRDRTVNPQNGAEVIQQAGGGIALDTAVTRGEAGGVSYTRAVQSDRNARPVLEQWTIHGAGHAWSGGNSAGSYADPHGPDASREMVRFFLHHTV